MKHPQRVICMTEESVETLFALGLEEVIVGVSAYVERPVEAKSIDKISAFTHANIKKILSKNPDLILGYSDIQQDIAKELISHGKNVFISNQRSIEEILNYIFQLGCLFNKASKAATLVTSLKEKISSMKNDPPEKAPKIYFEEWDEPRISCIKWVSELIEIVGGIDISKKYSSGVLAKDRFIKDEEIIEANPDIIFGCWCGKPFNKDQLKDRSGYHQITAVKNDNLFELPPEVFLQPGPAPILDGLDILKKFIDMSKY